MLVKRTRIYNIHQAGSRLQHLLQWGFVLLLLVVCSGTLKAQVSFESIDQKMRTEPKFIVMNVSTKSCVYCLMQQKKIQKNTTLRNRLESEVYYLSWMVDETTGITFNDKRFNSGKIFIDQYGNDENGFVAYPLWLIFDKEYKVLYRYAGVMSPEKISEILDIIKE